MKRLFENCGILAWKDEHFDYIPEGFLGVEDDRICYVGAQKPSEAYDDVRDMSGRLLMPGLINCHCHAAMTLLRGVGSNLPLDKWLFEVVFPLEDRLTDPDFIAGNELAMMEMIASGVTSFSDMYFNPCLLVESNEKIGMKINLSRVVQSFDPTETALTNSRIPEALDFFNRYHGAQDGRVRVDFCVHAEYTINDSVAKGFGDLLKDYADRGARLHIHLSETEKEQAECIQHHGCTPAAWFERMGLFDIPAFAAHCVWCTPEDLDILQRHSVSPVHNPSSNMKLGSGFAPIPEMLSRGMNVALGTDGAASNNNLNFFEEMHLASVIHNGHCNDPVLMNPEQILKMATINGARLQGRDDTGCIEIGKKADLIAVDFRGRAHLFPAFDPMSMLVYSAQASDVCMTMVDGRILYEDGRYFTLDPRTVLKNAQAAVERLYGREQTNV